MNLLRLFTVQINPDIREQVLRAIADPSQNILESCFVSDCDGCLFVVAASAALKVPIDVFAISEEGIVARIAHALGISSKRVLKGMETWDYATDGERETFRERIRAHLVTLDKEREQQMIQTASAADDQLNEMKALGAKVSLQLVQNNQTVSVKA